MSRAEPMLAPFAGWLVKPEWADRVISRAYDNLTPRQRRSIVRENPYSYVNVTRSSEDLLDDEDLSLDRLVMQGATALTRLLDAEVFAPTGRRALYLYRLTHARGSQTGLICTVAVSGFDEGRIRIHEGVRQDRTDLLTDHLMGVGATSHPVALAVRAWADSEYAALLDEAAHAALPDLEFGSELVRHQIWTVPANLTDKLLESLADKVLYVTDGHHRSAAAQRAMTRDPDNPVLARTLAAVFPHSQLHVEAYHRVVADQNHESHDDYLWALRSRVSYMGGELERVPSAEDARPRHRGEVGVYASGTWHRLTLPPPDSEAGALDALDVDRLRRLVLDPVLGAEELAATGTVDYVPDTAGLDELIRRCEAADRIGFVMYPLSVDELLAVADENSKMPPKSSFFYPKPRAGAFLRVLGRGATAHLDPS
ncbi:MAG: DUF1015 domain-containing protein [Acidimicrobiaceae bacterium]|nr:DUF1015 domain-containing protein [Acidimicrobiaceae bacterium]MYF34030.1 DUF1015 domain-containing protein [Acidimicrobiaceae bacterium]MYJ28525.1 DUF1015 domain-containing protein [Acidimicrobiaceae bacterium]